MFLYIKVLATFFSRQHFFSFFFAETFGDMENLLLSL